MNQMLSTLIMGIFLACIYIETQNIIFPILFHSLWDYILLNNSINDFPITGIIILLVYILEIIISIRLLFKYKKRNICLKSFINN
ncbi:CPBP family intramembrane glutamic endopeptidase [Streptococcus dysgalactiae]